MDKAYCELSLDGDSVEVGDRYVLEIDFIKCECYVHRNGNKIDYSIKFESEYIIPCLSLGYKGETVQITKYEFIYGE